MRSRRLARACAGLALAGSLAGSLAACGSDDGGGAGGGGTDDGGATCVGERTGQQVRQGTDGRLEDGTQLRVSALSTDGGRDGAYVRWAPGSGGGPTADPVRVSVGQTFDLGGAAYVVTGVCDDTAWVRADD